MDLILQALDIICESRLWKDKPPSHTLKILIYLKNKKWLYTPLVNGKVRAVIGAYRIPDVNDETLNRLPVKEEGKILYVPFVISTEKDNNIFRVVRQATRDYLDNNTDIEEIVLQGKDDKLRRFQLKGDENGKFKEPEFTESAAISD